MRSGSISVESKLPASKEEGRRSEEVMVLLGLWVSLVGDGFCMPCFSFLFSSLWLEGVAVAMVCSVVGGVCGL